MARAHCGHTASILDENEITEPHEALPEDTQAHEVVRPRPPRRAAPPPGPEPPPLARDLWPWLLALALLVAAGVLVWLLVFRDGSSSAGGPTVPAVVGLPQRQAIGRLTGQGFDVRAVVGPARAPRGIVASQEPGGGSRLDRGGTVLLHVSNGHVVRARPATTAGTTTAAPPPVSAAVPAVTGQDDASGAGQVEAAGLVAETAPADASAAAGTIVAQDPAAGASAKAGSVVRLSVATGSSRPAQQVPDVVGKTAATARAALLEAKLTVRTTYRKGKRGVVLAQTPRGGSLPAYTQVTIAVGS